MNQAILWLFLLQPILDNEARANKEPPIEEYSEQHNLDSTVGKCSKNRRNSKSYQKAVYKVCA
jgi:hypothetical protein